jgi:hypothetical protein
LYDERGADVVKDDLWKTRIDLLSEDERMVMEPFVERKMAEAKDRRIIEWDEEEEKAEARFFDLLFD